MQVKSTQQINDWHLMLYHEEDFMNYFINGEGEFIDVGAHVGCWAVKLAPFYDKVHAFEPHPEAFKALEENVKLNELNNVVTYNKAVGSENKEIQLTLYEHSSHSTLFEHHPMEEHTGPIKGLHTIGLVRLDDYKFDKVGFIKIDTEGYEVEVVKGALETIKKHKPKLCIEIHAPENEQKVIDLLPEIQFTKLSNGVQPYLIA